MSRPKVFLFSTPLSLIPAPLLGIPVLQGYLNNNDIECNSIDLNIKFIYWLLKDRALLDGFADEVIKEFNHMQNPQSISQYNAMKLLKCASQMSLIPQRIIEKYFGSKAVLGLKDSTTFCRCADYRVNLDSTDEVSSKVELQPKPDLPFSEAESYDECKDENPWKNHMSSLAIVLEMLGLMSNDLGGGVSELKATENRREAYSEFLNCNDVKMILKRAAACDVVGISAPFWLQQKEYTYMLAREIRKLNPKVFIILGGSGLTIMAKYSINEIKEMGIIDAIGLYQGELSLRMLAECIAKGEKIDGVPDLILFNNEKKSYVYTNHLPAIHPDLLPTPVFNNEELEMYYKLSENELEDKRVPIMISRGCYWDKCAFCTDSQCRHPETSPYELRSPEKVLDDIEKLQKLHRVTYFYLITSAMPPSWGKKFAKGVIERGIKAKFWTYTRALGEKNADHSYFQLLKEAGFDVITCGVESTVDHILSAISKGNGRTEITNTIQGLSDVGVRTKFNLIVDIPPSTYEDAKSNWDYIMDNLSYINDLSVFTFMLHMGSEMADNPEKFNIKVVTEKDGSLRELYPGTIAHTNPFYENLRAKEIALRTKNLSKDLQFFQLTQNVRNIIDSNGFSWGNSTIMFRPFTAIPSRISPFDAKNSEVYFVFLSDMFNFIVIPAEFEGFLKVCKQGVKAPVPFQKLNEAFQAGMTSYVLKSRLIKSESIAEHMLDRMAREGFILDIKAYGLFDGNQDMKPAKLDLRKNFPRAYGRYPSTERPFEFSTFPFAMVLDTKMV